MAGTSLNAKRKDILGDVDRLLLNLEKIPASYLSPVNSIKSKS